MTDTQNGSTELCFVLCNCNCQDKICLFLAKCFHFSVIIINKLHMCEAGAGL